MAYIELHREKLRHNYQFLNDLFSKHNVKWGVVSKLLCGNRVFLEELLSLGPQEVHDSRLSNLKMIKRLRPEVQTVYIKPPPKMYIKTLVRFADVSFNTEFMTIKAISEEAMKQDKIHKIIIMVEMGDLREGVMGENLLDFYSSVFKLPNIEVIGLGTNLNCLNGVMPSHDKLIQLSLYKQLIEATFNKKIPWVSGGTSVAIPLMMKGMMPKGNNHFRVGETLFMGNNLVDQKPIPGMKADVFKLYAEIIELTEKPKVPIGMIGQNVAGETPEFDEKDYGKKSYRAILDLGLLDIDLKNLTPEDRTLEFSGASSDMIVLDIGKNRKKLKVGDIVPFRLNYMGVLSILNSDYVEKRVV
jgi:predicted amino acid racemase